MRYSQNDPNLSPTHNTIAFEIHFIITFTKGYQPYNCDDFKYVLDYSSNNNTIKSYVGKITRE